MITSTYKEEHESFVSNLSGSSAECVVLCLAHVPACMLLTKMIQGFSAPRVLLDFMGLGLPLMLTMTVFSEYTVASMCFLLVMYAVTYKIRAGSFSFRSTFPPSPEKEVYGRTSYLTLSKGATVLFTCIAILAVDFPIFPRYFGKTETFGVSLMDYGVGSFMVSSACTSKFARGVVTGGFREAFSMKRFAVLLLGVSRLICVKVLNYQEHVSEYGVHWNFFVTLYCVWVVADILHSYLTRKAISFLAVALLIGYQLFLNLFGGTQYIFDSSRGSFVDANKEGIFSLFGYISLYLLMEVISFYFFHADPHCDEKPTPSSSVSGEHPQPESETMRVNSQSDTTSAQPGMQPNPSFQAATNPGASKVFHQVPGFDFKFVLRLGGFSLFVWALWLLLATMVQPTSRRLCNITYVCFSIALSCTLILATYVVDVLGDKSLSISTLNLMNTHSLAVFLIANVATGIINMTIKTIHSTVAESLSVMVVYTFVVCLTPWAMQWVTPTGTKS